MICLGSIQLWLLIMGILFASMKDARSAGDYVVLVHGLGRRSHSMRYIEDSLMQKGYQVIKIDYPSKRYPIEFLVSDYLSSELADRILNKKSNVHFVTHSMGGLLVRYYLKDKPIKNLGRVVMLSPPNQGSAAADLLAQNKLFQQILGPSLQQLCSSNDFLEKLGPVDFECGIITGDRSVDPFFSTIIDGPDDGKVAIDAAKVKGMKDFLIVHTSHPMILRRKSVQKQIEYFLERGIFDKHSSST
jgi:triacylglycerol lipase